MTVRYVPFLRWKSGEKEALRNLSPTARLNVVPFFLLGADNFKDKKATKKSSSIPAPSVFAMEALGSWGTAPFFLDASPLPNDASGAHPLTNIASSVLSSGGQPIPATSLNASPAYSAAVQSVVHTQQLGVALRVTLSEMTSAPSWLPSWPFPLPETDLIVDLADSAESVLALGAAVNTAFASLASAAVWRSVTLAGTSIPENFSKLAAGNYTRPRFEAQLWSQVANSGLFYQLDYGDYATVSTATPAPNIAWGYPITVKYTLVADYLICRGVKTTGVGSQDMGPQLVKHAKFILGFAGRGRLATCWADDTIDKIAGGTQSPKALAHWVSLAVNRHIELVRSVLP
ncbi:MAG TPA: hypothetical protein VGV07_09940 [Devosia sp.]|jgi:hypothetical protein|uniref:beta family protein n=1 Tax=Devosia sp. TaxID=1871048 RepID=UPI002DDCF20F|nr:hypothetical protein [Devosia sp.]HEV2515559.1 hypothetical protein [Devosia sp.]